MPRVGTRTHTLCGGGILNPLRSPIPPSRHGTRIIPEHEAGGKRAVNRRSGPEQSPPNTTRCPHPRRLRLHLPPELIAQAPLAERSASRLLVLEPQEGATPRLTDAVFSPFAERVNPGDLLVFNDTRVIHARLHGVKGQRRPGSRC